MAGRSGTKRNGTKWDEAGRNGTKPDRVGRNQRGQDETGSNAMTGRREGTEGMYLPYCRLVQNEKLFQAACAKVHMMDRARCTQHMHMHMYRYSNACTENKQDGQIRRKQHGRRKKQGTDDERWTMILEDGESRRERKSTWRPLSERGAAESRHARTLGRKEGGKAATAGGTVIGWWINEDGRFGLFPNG